MSAVLLLGIGSSQAYILKGPHILDLMARKIGQAKSMLVTQQVLFFHAGEDGATQATETLRYVFSDAFRSDAQSQNAERIHLLRRGASVTVIDGRISDNDESPFDAYKDLMLYRSRERLQDRLAALGVDVSMVAFGRFENKIAYVIGAERPEEPVSQVWIAKDSFLPMRWLMRKNGEAEDPEALEIRYGEWRQVDGVWYPMQIHFYRNDTPVREIRVETLKTNLTFPMDLFDIASLKMKYASRVPEAKEGSVSGEISEIEQSIDEFRKKYE